MEQLAHSFDCPDGVDLQPSICDRMVQVSHVACVVYVIVHGSVRGINKVLVFLFVSPGEFSRVQPILGYQSWDRGDQETLSMRECSTFTERISSIMGVLFSFQASWFPVFPMFPRFLGSKVLKLVGSLVP